METPIGNQNSIEEVDTQRIRQFIEEHSMRHWLWTINGITKALEVIVLALKIEPHEVGRILLDIHHELSKSTAPEDLATKSEEAKRSEAIVDDMMNNPNSEHIQHYGCGYARPKEHTVAQRLWHWPFHKK